MGSNLGRTLGIVVGGAVALPAPVLAAFGSNVDPLNVIVSAVGLGVAIFLLVEALQVRKLATGGAIAERISLVVLATICLATSALLEWTWNFVPAGLTADQASLAARLLVIAAMGLLAAYFWSVRAAMQRFLDSLTGSELLDALDPSADSDETADSDARPMADAADAAETVDAPETVDADEAAEVDSPRG